MKIVAAIENETFGRAILDYISNGMWPVDAEFHFVNVIPWIPSDKELHACPALVEFADGEKSKSRRLMNAMSDRFRKQHPSGRTSEVTLFGVASEAILAYAAKIRADEIIVACHNRSGWGHFFLGSVSMALLQNAPCTITVLRPGSQAGSKRFRPVMVPQTEIMLSL
jgi:nucleotide-binding universal stress UspA family protein